MLHDAIQTKKLIFYSRYEVKHGFLLLLINRMLIFGVKGFPIEFHAELKNELFV